MQQSRVKLADISRRAVCAPPNLPVQGVLALFQEDPDLLSVVIEEKGAFLGSVNRKELLTLLSRPFALELYAKKPVLTLMRDLKGKRIVLPPDLEVNEAAVELLSLDPTLQTDALALVSGRRCRGIVSVSDLMMAVADQQKELLRALDRLSSRLREEVTLGMKIQQDLLPPPDYHFGGLTIGAGMATCSEIGGDFFDYFSAGDKVLGVVIADVSGHGVQAGMVTTAAKASLHTLVSLGVTTPSGLLAGMNRAILATARRSLLMTCLIACIDLGRGEITFANAGHNYPLLLRGDAACTELLEAESGFPLGFDREACYPETSTGFAPGDLLFLYTDGLVESAPPHGEEFGYRRLAELLVRGRELPVGRMHDHLMTGVAGFTGSGTFEDDVTTLAARFDT